MLRVWGAHISRGLYMEGLIVGILRFVREICMGVSMAGRRRTYEMICVKS